MVSGTAGNYADGIDDWNGMECESARMVLSAMLDGEQAEFDPELAERHLTACAACQRWYDAAARLDRMARLSPASEDVHGHEVADRVLGSVRLPRRGLWRGAVRVALVLVGLFQLSIGVINVFGPWGLHAGMSVSAHMSHEGAAFNLAFGVALLLVGLNTRRAATLVPVFGSFVLVLAVVSVFDLASGAVGWSRLATHVPIVLGLLLTITVARGPQGRRSGPAGAAAQPPRRWPGQTRSAARGDWDTAPGVDPGTPPVAHREPRHRRSA